jgi:hypothetical protein
MDVVMRDALRQILLSWQAGHMTPHAVHEWASDRYPARSGPDDDLVTEILARLDMLDMNLITTDDIPVLMQALDLPLAQMAEAIHLLERHDATVDMAARKRALANDPFYGRYSS